MRRVYGMSWNKRRLKKVCSMDNKERYFNVLFLGIMIFLLIINLYTPLMGEDYALNLYSQYNPSMGGKELLYKMILRIQEQMQGWNVRLGEQLSIVFGCFDKVLFDVCNCLVTVYYMWLISAYAYKKKEERKKRKNWILLGAFSLIIIFQPALGQIFFWRTGSTNYLWSLCILLTFGLPIRYLVGKESVDLIGKSRIKMILLTIMGFFAGFTNENTVLVFLLLYLGVISYRWIKREAVPKWVYCSFISLGAGFIFMLKAPSTGIRMAYYNQVFGIDELGLMDYVMRAKNVIIRFFVDHRFYVWGALLSIIFGCVVFVYYNRKQWKAIIEAHGDILGLLLLTSVSCGALIMSPYVETRAFLLTDFMLVTSIIYYFDLGLQYIKKSNVYRGVISIILLFLTIPTMKNIYDVYKEYYEFCLSREKNIECSDSPVNYWGEYYGENDSRILTTREDYLVSSERYLESYFNKTEIVLLNGAVWNLGVGNYVRNQALGNTDDVSYNAETQICTVNGWYTFTDSNSADSQVYIGIKTDDNIYYFKTQKYERKDVEKAFLNADYLKSGFRAEILNLPMLFNSTENREVKISVCVVDREKMFFDEIRMDPFMIEP